LKREWHEDDRFWERTAPFQFSERRWAAAPEEAERIIALLGLEPGAAVLDLCCGPGRHSLELARRGFKVAGVDRMAQFLEEARRRAETEGLQIELVREDMRVFRRPGAFDAAINLFTSFGYFEDLKEDRKVLENIYDSLRPGGRLLLDVMGKEVLARIFRERDWIEEDGLILLEERRLHDGWSRIETRWIIVQGGKRQEFTLKLRLYSGAELATLLQEVGFRTVELFGSLEGAPYDQKAKRLIAYAMK
jgi:SAM-dependent methyltransferase